MLYIIVNVLTTVEVAIWIHNCFIKKDRAFCLEQWTAIRNDLAASCIPCSKKHLRKQNKIHCIQPWFLLYIRSHQTFVKWCTTKPVGLTFSFWNMFPFCYRIVRIIFIRGVLLRSSSTFTALYVCTSLRLFIFLREIAAFHFYNATFLCFKRDKAICVEYNA